MVINHSLVALQFFIRTIQLCTKLNNLYFCIVDLKDRIKELSNQHFKEVRDIRRHIHQNPELSFVEHNTIKFIKERLQAMGIEDIKEMAETGASVLIKGNNPESKTIALRADIDALPIHEENEVEYASRNEGVMHACGHDVHSSSLLGAAMILNELKSEFQGTVKLVFQPGEEKLPGGASLMIRDGVLENPKVDRMFGQHVMPLIEVGKVGFRKGLYMASADEIYIKVVGKGGHAAHPHLNIDPVAISAQIITALQHIPSRKSKPSMPTVLSIGKVIANGATNVIPDEVNMEGTFRTFDEDWRMEAHQLIQDISQSIAASNGAKAEVEVRKGYPFLYNDEPSTECARNYAVEYLGEENVEELEIWPAGEDFAFYSQKVPSCFYRLGTRNTALGITSMLHTPTFNVDEEALKIGMGLISYIAFKELSFNE